MTPKFRVAIVEDDESLRFALEGLIRSIGHTPVGCQTAEAFLAENAGLAVDCLITDIHLPGLSGIDLSEMLQTDSPSLPIIAITGRSETGLEQRVLAAGATCLLKKPFDTAILVATIEETLAKANR